MTIVNLALKLKSWTVFALLVGIPVLVQFILLTFMTFSTETLALFAIVGGPAFLGYLFWILSVIVYIPRTYYVGNPILTRVCYGGIILNAVDVVFSFRDLVAPEMPDGVFVRIIQVTSTIALFGSMLYAAYLIRSAESREAVPLSKCLREFFMFWIFPIGVWFLQPRLNKLVLATNAGTAQ